MGFSDKMTALREVMARLCPTGSDAEAVDVGRIMAELGWPESERGQTRNRLNKLKGRGELRRVSRAMFTLGAKPPPQCWSGAYAMMWRAVRVQRLYGGFFTLPDVLRICQTDQPRLYRYVRFLIGRGLVRKAGKRKCHALYELTDEGREHLETPLPRIGEALTLGGGVKKSAKSRTEES